MSAQVISIVNQKGGVGKSVSCLNLAVGLAKEGKRVLALDFDPQASLTISLGYPHPDELPVTITDMMKKVIDNRHIAPDEGVLHLDEGIDLMPANIDLAGMEVALVNEFGRETILRQYIDIVRNKYTHILVDCQPSLGMLPINALFATTRIIIPCQAEYLSAKGMETLLTTISKIRRHNPGLHIDGILLTMVNKRTNFAREMNTLIHETYGSLNVFKAEIPHSVRAKECSAEGKSIFAHDPRGKVAEAYKNLTWEVLQIEKYRTQNRAGLSR